MLLTVGAFAVDLEAKIWIVAPSGGDFTKIQDALDSAQPGDTILVKDKTGGYSEKIHFPRSGNATAGPIVLRAFPGHSPAIDGRGVPGSNMVLINDKSYVTLDGFEIRNNLNVKDGSGVRIIGAGSNIAICYNTIHDVRGDDAMGITVYGTSETASISDLVIEGNEIYDCDPAHSEALTLNGNVEDFEVLGNTVRDVNNIGIDFIGGEKSINKLFGCRNGVCRGNRVLRANSNYGGGFGAGIYVDGAKDIVIEGNFVTQCDLGIEIGAENPGIVTSGIEVRDNIVYRNDKAGIVFGGFSSAVGTVTKCKFFNNTCYANDAKTTGVGELWIQWASGNEIRNNIFVASQQNVLTYSELGNVNNSLDYNSWFTLGSPGQAEFVWRAQNLVGFAAFRQTSKQGANSRFMDPKFVDPANDDFSPQEKSPVIDAAEPKFRPARSDAAGSPRVQDGDFSGSMRLDHGAFEFAHLRLAVDGDLVGGGQLNVKVTGSANLPSFLVIATKSAALAVDPIGVLLFDPSAPWALVPWGAIPATKTIPLPASLPAGLHIRFQAFCRGAQGGNTSNAVDRDRS